MDSCVLTQLYKPRSSFVKPHVEAPRQVIGFNLLPKEETVKAHCGGLDNNSLPNSEIIKRANEGSTSPKGASSPRSALQQLLLSQSQPATSSPSANHNSTHALLKPQPPRSPQSSNHNLTGRLLTPAPSASPSPPANQCSTSGIFKSVDQTQCASSPAPSPSAANQSSTTRHESDKERSNTVIQQNHEMKGRLTGLIKEVSNEQYSCAGRSKQSSWKEAQQIDEHHACVGLKSKKSSWKEVGTNPEKSKKSSLFMFVVSSSPAAEYHQHHHAHFFTEKDMDFLNSCHLCRRFLGQGQDVFMYSGDKAFCSMECRYQQIVIDERNERRAPPVIRSGASQIMYNQSATTMTTTSATATTSATHHPIVINKPKYFINNTAAAA